MQKKEIWKDISEIKSIDIQKGVYMVSNIGRIKSIPRKHRKTELVLKQNLDKHGYYNIKLIIHSNQKSFLVHRLKAMAFIPNPQNKPEVNHIDGVKTNNGYNSDGKDNLEWATRSENQCHAYKYGLTKASRPMLGKFNYDCQNSKPVIQLSLDGNMIMEYGSAREVTRKTGIHYSCISKCCIGSRNSTGGFMWKFKLKPKQ